ncbi:hypothetical protein ER308_05555 [Egibacter rhizosphaerae]|uniref:Uncharacterized protein n=1 Tax=Egibacter rhizosphaerae TaxID=1670831 RepID=A0A411YCT6_9ACTN|nr:hypothetical protein ER308_05555 [Egibacter rhizosphaerae]
MPGSPVAPPAGATRHPRRHGLAARRRAMLRRRRHRTGQRHPARRPRRRVRPCRATARPR